MRKTESNFDFLKLYLSQNGFLFNEEKDTHIFPIWKMSRKWKNKYRKIIQNSFCFLTGSQILKKKKLDENTPKKIKLFDFFFQWCYNLFGLKNFGTYFCMEICHFLFNFYIYIMTLELYQKSLNTEKKSFKMTTFRWVNYNLFQMSLFLWESAGV